MPVDTHSLTYSLNSLMFQSEVIHLFVDGSWEGGVAGLGAVLFDTKSQKGRVWQRSLCQ